MVSVCNNNPRKRQLFVILNNDSCFYICLLKFVNIQTYAKSTSDLLFKGNRIIRTTELQPSSGNKNTFLLNGCDRVVIEGTSFEGEVLGRNLRIENMKKKNVCYSKDIMFEK